MPKRDAYIWGLYGDQITSVVAALQALGLEVPPILQYMLDVGAGLEDVTDDTVVYSDSLIELAESLGIAAGDMDVFAAAMQHEGGIVAGMQTQYASLAGAMHGFTQSLIDDTNLTSDEIMALKWDTFGSQAQDIADGFARLGLDIPPVIQALLDYGATLEAVRAATEEAGEEAAQEAGIDVTGTGKDFELESLRKRIEWLRERIKGAENEGDPGHSFIAGWQRSIAGFEEQFRQRRQWLDDRGLTHQESFQTGTDFVPRTGLHGLHRGEAVLTAADNTRLSHIDAMVSSLGDLENAGETSPKIVVQLGLDLEVDDSRRLHLRQAKTNTEFGTAVLDVVRKGLRTNKDGLRRKVGEVRGVRGVGKQ